MPVLAIAAGIAAGVFVLTTTGVGVRLAWMARRAPSSPEFLLGSGMVVIGLLGYPLGLVSGLGRGSMAEVSIPVWLASFVAIDVGLLCIYGFTWRVFRPDAAWARSLVAAAGVLLAGVTLGQLHALVSAPPEASSADVSLPWTLPFLVGSATCFLWTGIESGVQHRMARRRVAVGLGNPVVANRFVLWAVFGAAATVINLASAVSLAMGVHGGSSPAVQLTTGVCGAVAAGAIYLACVPPDWYLARVRGAAATPVAGPA